MKYITIILLILVSTSASGASPPPRILATIKPIHSLVASVTAGVTEPGILIDGVISVHDYMLKPSDARKLENSSVIFYVDNGLETFIPKIKNKILVQLSDVSDTLPQRASYILAKDNSLQTTNSEKDVHMWLSPQNAKKMVARISEVMCEIDQDNAAIYVENAKLTIAKIDNLIKEISYGLQYTKDLPYIVTHDAYQYFEKYFGLNVLATMSINDELSINFKAMNQIAKLISTSQVRCVFSESDDDDRLVNKLSTDTKKLTLQTLDPIGLSIPSGQNSYFTMMENLYRDFNKCFATAAL